MKRVYRIGGRLRSLKRITCLVTGLLLFLFYFIYNIVFSAVGIGRSASLALLVTGLMAMLLYRLIDWYFARYREAVRYEIDELGLSCVNGRTVRRYEWADFVRAEFDYAALFSLGAVRFHMKDGSAFGVNRYIERSMELVYEILLRIQDHAAFEEGLLEKVGQLRKLD